MQGDIRGAASNIHKYNAGFLFFIAVSSITILPIFMASWASRNKYSLLGGMRTAARGAHIYAEFAGGATNNNAFHMTAPAKAGAGSAAVMRAALADAGLPPDAVAVSIEGSVPAPKAAMSAAPSAARR